MFCLLEAVDGVCASRTGNPFSSHCSDFGPDFCMVQRLQCCSPQNYFCSFFINLGFEQPDISGVAIGTSVPMLKSYAITQAVGTLGAVIMPHNLYLHSALVGSRKVDLSDRRAVAEANFCFALEGALALFVSYLINAAVLITFAVHFFDDDCANQDGGPYALVNGVCSSIGAFDWFMWYML